jgi:signal transduction histidine kinase
MIARVDATLFRSIVTNLLANALKFSAPRTSVLITIDIKETALMLKIRDNGIGIPEADRANVFDLFYRAANVGIIQGTGMGLTIVKRSVDAHKGTISIDSELEKGTTMTVVLPTTESVNM